MKIWLNIYKYLLFNSFHLRIFEFIWLYLHPIKCIYG